MKSAQLHITKTHHFHMHFKLKAITLFSIATSTAVLFRFIFDVRFVSSFFPSSSSSLLLLLLSFLFLSVENVPLINRSISIDSILCYGFPYE